MTGNSAAADGFGSPNDIKKNKIMSPQRGDPDAEELPELKEFTPLILPNTRRVWPDSLPSFLSLMSADNAQRHKHKGSVESLSYSGAGTYCLQEFGEFCRGRLSALATTTISEH
jgi:hypothetical protein